MNVKWILQYLKRVVSYENWKPSVLNDNAEYLFGLMEFLMLIYLNLVFPREWNFMKMNRSGINEIFLDCDQFGDEWKNYNVALIGV